MSSTAGGHSPVQCRQSLLLLLLWTFDATADVSLFGNYYDNIRAHDRGERLRPPSPN